MGLGFLLFHDAPPKNLKRSIKASAFFNYRPLRGRIKVGVISPVRAVMANPIAIKNIPVRLVKIKRTVIRDVLARDSGKESPFLYAFFMSSPAILIPNLCLRT
jgi:hypothetical protein